MLKLHLGYPTGSPITLDPGDTVHLHFQPTQGHTIILWGFLRNNRVLYFEDGKDKQILHNTRHRSRRQIERDLVGHLAFLGYTIRKSEESRDGRISYFDVL